LCRFEQGQDRSVAVELHKVLLDQFIVRHSKPPRRLILDFDATDIPVHGEQEQRFFHGYYDSYCFMPLYVFCGRHLLVSYLRHCRQDGAKHSWAILALLVKALRKQWPEVELIFRGDSGFCRHRMLDWCDRHGVKYIVGIARNNRLEYMLSGYMHLAKEWSRNGAFKLSLFKDFQYAAGSWKHRRRIIGKAEYTHGGSNPRFVTTNLDGDGEALYRQLYCARGDMENRIKDQQLDLFAGRTSCHRWWPNQWRLLLSALAWILFEELREQLKNTPLAWAILALLVKALRKQWPEVEIVFRGDSGFCRHRMLDWCDRHGVKYIVGIARNNRLEYMLSGYMHLAKEWSRNGAFKLSLFKDFQYAAGSWKHRRRIIGKAEYTHGGFNPRFVTTNLDGDGEALYRQLYCARGDMENRIKDQQLDLFAGRTSCHRWWPNQWRLLLSALAWVLFEELREQLKNTPLAKASVGTLRNRLIKVAAVVIKNTRRLRFLLPTSMPDREIFCKAAARLVPI
ncbi:IS1380 family transposase, partial [Microbulbifer sp. TYP-18]|uniref:IS1380 family transposase n=1 Tax=Microbulbifer sp. TYP-18 TaxID=3230024 RepID=UPI0034C6C107